jgi:hypothetical protein
MWYTGTLLTGIHYGTGQRTTDISVQDSVHAMRVGCLLLRIRLTKFTNKSIVLVALLPCVCVLHYVGKSFRRLFLSSHYWRHDIPSHRNIRHHPPRRSSRLRIFLC